MALTKNYNRYGTTFNNAYFQITTVQTSKAQGYTVLVQVFVSATAATSGVEAISQLSYQIPYREVVDNDADGNPDVFQNPVAFAYALLKTLPDYADATDA
ncbi:MAG: hypothetical protein EOO77_42405 [Oxalobacteraceae bacterium]|nr:MAG: hypothetical protein EOO77_42405 [Oxalobacteraceae bacterium]